MDNKLIHHLLLLPIYAGFALAMFWSGIYFPYSLYVIHGWQGPFWYFVSIIGVVWFMAATWYAIKLDNERK